VTDDAALDEHSRRLLHEVRGLQELERQKRAEPRSSEQFHELAETVEASASNVWKLAHEEAVAGEDDSPIPQERRDQRPGDWTAGDADASST
jgi:hypothetical protein